MRAAERCQEHWQGDRCRMDRTHTTVAEPELRHAGNFTMWEGSGESKQAVAVTPGSRLTRRTRRSRSLNRILRAFTRKKTDVNLLPNAHRKTASGLLDLALRMLGREAESAC